MLVFAAELQIVRTTCISCDSEGGLGQVSKRHVRGRLKKALKNSILLNLHQDEAVRTYCDKDEAYMSWKWFSATSTSKALVRNFNSATRLPLTLGTFPTLWDSSHQKKKTAMGNSNNASGFDRSHLNHVSAVALFHGGHLFMRDEGCTVQN